MTRILSTIILSLCFLFSNTQPVTFGNGSSGDKIAGKQEIVNKYFKVTKILSSSKMVVQGSDTIKNNDVVLLIQMEGVHAGNWEFLRVLNRQVDTVRFYNSGFQKSYTDTSAIQLIRVPQYNDLSVWKDSMITCPAWNGNVGGVISFLIKNGFTLGGKVSADGKGYQAANSGQGGQGGIGGSVGAAGYLGAVGGNTGAVSGSGIGRGGDGGMYGDTGVAGILPQHNCAICGDTANNLSVMNVGYNNRKLRLGGSGRSGMGGRGGDGGGGGGGGAHGLLFGTGGTWGGSGGGGGNGGKGGNGGGIILFQAKDLYFTNSGKISANGESATHATSGVAGQPGGNGGLGGGTCLNGGGGGGGRGADGGDGGRGGSGGASGVVNYMMTDENSFNRDSVFSVIAGKKGGGGAGGKGGAGGLNGGLLNDTICIAGPGPGGLPIHCGVDVPVECHFDSAMIQFRRMFLNCPNNGFDTIVKNVWAFECNGDSVYLYQMDSFTVSIFSIHNGFGYYSVITDTTLQANPFNTLLAWRNTGNVLWASTDSTGVIQTNPPFAAICLSDEELIRAFAPNGSDGASGSDGTDGGGVGVGSGVASSSDFCAFYPANYNDPLSNFFFTCDVEDGSRFSEFISNHISNLNDNNPSFVTELIDFELPNFWAYDDDWNYYLEDYSSAYMTYLVTDTNGCVYLMTKYAEVTRQLIDEYADSVKLSNIVCLGNSSGGIVISDIDHYPCNSPEFTVELTDLDNGGSFIYEGVKANQLINDFPEGSYLVTIVYPTGLSSRLIFEDTFHFNVQHNYMLDVELSSKNDCVNPYFYVSNTNGVGEISYEWSADNGYDPLYIYNDTLYSTENDPWAYGYNFFDDYFQLIAVDSNGCEATIYTDLITKERVFRTIDTTVCSGTTFTFYNNPYTSPGTYNRTRFGIYCDTAYTINLSFNSPQTYNASKFLCPEKSFQFGSIAVSQPGVYTQTLKTSKGCDSIVQLTVTHPPVTDIWLSDTPVCPLTPFVFRDSVFMGAGSYEYFNGCDTIFHFSLLADVIYGDMVEVPFCLGQLLTIGNITIVEHGYYEVVHQSFYGCDSIVDYFTVYPPPDSINLGDIYICNPKEEFIFRNEAFSSEGYHEYYTTHDVLCDTTFGFTLHWIDLWGDEVNTFLCTGDTFRLGNVSVTTDTVFDYVFVTPEGCDSTVTYWIHFDDYIRVNLSNDFCPGRSFNFFGESLSEAGTYTHISNATEGCDTLFTLNLSVNDYLSASKQFDLCAGDSLWINNKILVRAEGVYADTLFSTITCDTVYTYTVTHREIPSVNLQDTVVACCDDKLVALSSNFNLVSINWSTGDAGTSATLRSSENISETVRVSFEDIYGCKGSDSLLFINCCLHTELPLVTARPDTVFIFTPESYQDTATLTAHTSYSENLVYYWRASGEDLSLPPVAEIAVTPQKTTNYFLVVTDSLFRCADSIAVEIVVIEPGYMALPNVFSPNGDNLNDEYYPVFFGTHEPVVKTFRVYNKWGQVMHQDIVPWDGKFEGVLQPSGTYHYFIEVEVPKRDLQGVNKIVKEGAMSLVR